MNACEEHKSIITTIQDKVNAIHLDKSIMSIKRAQYINLLKAEKIIHLKSLTAAKEKEQALVRKAFNLEVQASYRKFLSEQAKFGDEIALEELRQLRIKFDKQQDDAKTFNYINRYQKFRLDIIHEVDNAGNILYKLDDTLIIKDTGKKLKYSKILTIISN